MLPTSFVKTFGSNNPEEILAGEFLLCQGLRFAIDVKHPFRALRGALMELAALPDIDVRLPAITPLNIY
jgi:cyclin H